jgi:phage N-6-adenine-methyltransferase
MAEPKQKPGSSKQDYGTPWSLIRAIEARWGSLTIDLAARADNAKAPLFITPEEDSLKQNWTERIGGGLGWLNPEFADIDPWARQCKRYEVGSDFIMLTPASIGSEWFAEHCEGNTKIVGLRPRIKFEGCHNLDKNKQRRCDDSCLGCASYPKDCMLSLWGSRFDREPVFQTWRWDVPVAKISAAA